MKVTLADALARLPLPATTKWPLGVWDVQMLAHGSMSVSLFAPKETDFQTPHEQDELYLIVTGAGQFQDGDERYSFGPGDVIFVPAGREHRFVELSPDLVTWVVFYGPAGGEATGA